MLCSAFLFFPAMFVWAKSFWGILERCFCGFFTNDNFYYVNFLLRFLGFVGLFLLPGLWGFGPVKIKQGG